MTTTTPQTARARSAARIAILYLLFGTAWIVLSDVILGWFVTEYSWVQHFQTHKRWFFVAASGVGIYGLLRLELARLTRAEAALAATHQKYRDLVEGSIQGLSIQRDFVVLFANTAFARIFGFDHAEDIIGTHSASLIDPEDLTRCQGYYHARMTGQPAPTRYEFRARKLDGTPIWVSNLVTVVSWDGAPSILQTMVDVTEAKQANEALRQEREARAKVEHLAALGRLAAGVAHELRNPLSVIVGRIQLLQHHVRASGAPALEAVARHFYPVEEAVDRMRRIVDSMTAYARPQPPAPVDLGIPELLHHVVTLVGYQARSSGVRLTTECADDLPQVQADRTQMVQILLNLATNAIEAIAEAGREGTVTLRGLTEFGPVVIEVADDGPGIPADRLDQIWDPFYTTKPEGTGLGLSIVRSLVDEQPGAKLTLESTVGGGTTFRVVMPTQTSHAAVR